MAALLFLGILTQLLLGLVVLSGVCPEQVLDGGQSALEEGDDVEDGLVRQELGVVPSEL